MSNPLRKRDVIVGVLVGTLFIGLSPSRVRAFSSGPAKLAGVATMTPADGGGITITFPPLPNAFVAGGLATWTACNPPGAGSCPYVVVMGQASNASAYSPTTDCTYLNVLHKRQTQFEVQHKRCSDGSVVSLTGNVQLNWAIFKCAASSALACQ